MSEPKPDGLTLNTISGSNDMLRNVDVGEILRLREQLSESDRKLAALRAAADGMKLTCERRMSSDEACENPFDEDMATALRRYAEVRGGNTP